MDTYNIYNNYKLKKPIHIAYNMKIYNRLHWFDNLYKINNNNITEDKDSFEISLKKIHDERQKLYDQHYAEYIHTTLQKMLDTEKCHVLNKILSPQQINRILLRYELDHYNPIPKIMSLTEFRKETIKILSRYQHRAGGEHLEDMIWTEHKNTL